MSVQQVGTHYQDVPGWELSDSFWERIKPLLPKDKSRYRGRGKARKHIGGRPAADKRRVMAGILYVLRTGCQWNAVHARFTGLEKRFTGISRDGSVLEFSGGCGRLDWANTMRFMD